MDPEWIDEYSVDDDWVEVVMLLWDNNMGIYLYFGHNFAVFLLLRIVLESLYADD